MKLLHTATLALLLSSSALFAAPKGDIAADMRSMLSAMEEIQKAGFYNDKEGMKAGVNKLKNGLKSLRATDAKSYLPNEKAYADRFAKKRADMIVMYADDLLDSLKHDNLDNALEDYSQILKQCTSCHFRMRSY